MSEQLEFLLTQLADESRPVRTLNLIPLSDVPRDLTPRFRAAWLDLSIRRRLELISTMVEQAEANIRLNFHIVFRECLSDADAQVRRLAIEGLWEDERTSLVASLVTLLAEDPAAEVRAAAAASLGRFVLLGVLGEIRDSYALQAEQALRSAWKRPNEANEVRRRVLEGLAYLNDLSVYDLVDNAYFDEDELMRQSAVFAMGRSADRRWSKYVIAELGSPAPAMRFEAATAAGELGLSAAVKPLIRLLDDPDGSVREAAVLALGKIGGPEARRAVEICLDSQDERLAEAAGEAMEELTFNSGTFDDALLDYRPEDRTTSAQGHPGDEGELDDDFDELWEEEYGGDEEDFDLESDAEEDEDWDDEEEGENGDEEDWGDDEDVGSD